MSQTATQDTIKRNMNSKEVDLALTMRLASLNINQALDSPRGVAADYGRLVVLYGIRGELDRAESMLMQAVEIERTLGRKDVIAQYCSDLGRLCLAQGTLDKAEHLFRESLAV